LGKDQKPEASGHAAGEGSAREAKADYHDKVSAAEMIL
jgi:hypothetical protein